MTAIKVKVEKLLKARFNEEVLHITLSANVVMVKKVSGSWKICVDFTNLIESSDRNIISVYVQVSGVMFAILKNFEKG